MFPISIRTKIILPYVMLFSFVIALVSIVTVRIIYRSIDERIEGQMLRAADVISSMKFMLSDEFLKNVRISDAVNADVILYHPDDNDVMATTFAREEIPQLMSVIGSEDVKLITFPIFRKVIYLGHPYKVIYYPYGGLNEGETNILVLMVSMLDINAAKRKSTLTIGLIAFSGIFLTLLLGIIISLGITSSIRELLRTTMKVASGDLDARAKVNTSDEIGALAEAFNNMTSELKLSRDKLIQSERLAVVGQISAGIAHEIRNPLTSMKMIMQMLRNKLRNDEQTAESIAIVLQEIDRIDLIVSSLLDFARPTELSLKLVDIRDILNDVLKVMDPNLSSNNISVIKRLGEDVPELMLDENKMRQALMNIIINSIHAMPEGGTLTVTCGYDREASFVELTIADTGIGMSQDVLEHVFDPFFSRRHGGTGLGLTNVKRIIEQHGGTVNIESEEGVGTKVTMNFPCSLSR